VLPTTEVDNLCGGEMAVLGYGQVRGPEGDQVAVQQVRQVRRAQLRGCTYE